MHTNTRRTYLGQSKYTYNELCYIAFRGFDLFRLVHLIWAKEQSGGDLSIDEKVFW